jgi:hypothetical protein
MYGLCVLSIRGADRELRECYSKIGVAVGIDRELRDAKIPMPNDMPRQRPVQALLVVRRWRYMLVRGVPNAYDNGDSRCVHRITISFRLLGDSIEQETMSLRSEHN